MRILLAMPPWSVSDFFTGDLGDDVGGAWHPYSILQLAACLEQAGYEVQILDGGFLNRKQFLAALDRIKPDFIGFYTTVFLWYSARDTSIIIKERYPGTKIIIGGPIATAMKDKLLDECPAVDFLCVGEGEELIVEVARKVETCDSDFAEVRGLLWRRDGEIVTNPPRCEIEDLDSLPFAARHLIDVRAYRPPLGTYKRLPAIYLFTSRGCNGGCIFCWQNNATAPSATAALNPSLPRLINATGTLTSRRSASLTITSPTTTIVPSPSLRALSSANTT